ncbi:MAG TPA: hypothetical protein VLX92_25770 [Kofleriaceae bacterium]|nr:hypothetical protein [Kofleriaceae bacterium]
MRTQLIAYAVIGALGTPVARFAGEPAAALFCVVAVLGWHLWRHANP